MIIAFPSQEAADELAQHRVATLAARLARTLGIACALAETGRHIDLTGIEDGVGILCAQALDLPRPQGAIVRPVLQDVLARVERLTDLLQCSRGL